MSSRPSRPLLGSVKLRLTLLSTSLFVFGTSIAFFLLYRELDSMLARQVDSLLTEEFTEYSALYASGGLAEVQQEIAT
ncbi:MAG: hypothetical protein JXR94_12930, partial [Candidatus Hydrogenedentes bacterium]|nr:hypothetical protein [Candidatus Hydrogenedentota bacterium]